VSYADDCLARINETIRKDTFTRDDALDMVQTFVSMSGYLTRGGFIPREWRRSTHPDTDQPEP